MILYEKTIGSKKCIFMDEYYVLHFYEVKPTIKYCLGKNLYVICVHNLI